MKKKHIRLLNECYAIIGMVEEDHARVLAAYWKVKKKLEKVVRAAEKRNECRSALYSASEMVSELHATMDCFDPEAIRESLRIAIGDEFDEFEEIEEIDHIPNHINAAEDAVGSQVFIAAMQKNLEDFNTELFGIRVTIMALHNEIKSAFALTAKIPEMTDEERKNIVRIITTEELNGIFKQHVTDDLMGAPKTGKTGPAASILGEGADSGATTPSEDTRQPHFPAQQQAESGLAAIPTHENPSEGPSCADSEVVPVSSVIPVRDDFDDADDVDPVMPENENKWVPPRRPRRTAFIKNEDE